jgi:hypothetical protein
MLVVAPLYWNYVLPELFFPFTTEFLFFLKTVSLLLTQA